MRVVQDLDEVPRRRGGWDGGAPRDGINAREVYALEVTILPVEGIGLKWQLSEQPRGPPALTADFGRIGERRAQRLELGRVDPRGRMLGRGHGI
jgi:hypothetical protein